MQVYALGYNYELIGQAMVTASDIAVRLKKVETLPKSPNIALYGGSITGCLALFGLRDFCRISAILENDPEKQGLSMLEAPVIVPEELEVSVLHAIILSAHPQHYEAMTQSLKKAFGCACPLVIELFNFYENSSKTRGLVVNINKGVINLGADYFGADFALDLSSKLMPYFDPRVGESGFIVYGMGLAGALCCLGMINAGVAPEFISDTNPCFSGMSFLGAEIVQPDNLPLDPGKNIVVALGVHHADSFRDNILDRIAQVNSVQYLFKPTSGDFFLHGYKLVSPLGCGSTSVVWKAQDKDKALKIIKLFKHSAQRDPALIERGEKQAPIKDSNGKIVGTVIAFKEAFHIPQPHFAVPQTAAAVFAMLCSEQAELMKTKNHIFTDYPVQKNIMVSGEGRPFIADIEIKDLAFCNREKAALSSIKVLASIRRDIFYQAEQMRNLPDYKDEMLFALAGHKDVLPEWMAQSLYSLLNMTAEEILCPETFEQIAAKIPSNGVLSEELLYYCKNPQDLLPAPGLPETRDNISGYQENDYQNFFYAPGVIIPSGGTKIKYESLPADWAEHIKGRNYLDIGSSSGFFVIKAALCGASYSYGVDNSVQCTARSRRVAATVGVKNTKFLALTIPTRELGREQFDAVSVFSVMHHLFGTGAYSSFEDMVRYISGLTKNRLYFEYVGPALRDMPDYIAKCMEKNPSLADYSDLRLEKVLEELFSEVICLGKTLSENRKLYFASGKKRSL